MGDGCEGCGEYRTRRRFLSDCIGIGLTLSVLPRRAVGESAGSTVRYPLPAVDGVTVDRDKDVILVRWQGAVYAFARSCPHQNTALTWLDKDTRFQCPKHKSRYQPDGTFISGRATRAMDRFSVRLEGSEVVVDLCELHQQDKHPAEWAAAAVRLNSN
jgi:Rieske Fe-S protein